MSAELEAYRRRILDALVRMAALEGRAARKAHPMDEVSEVEMHHHAERCLMDAVKTVEGLPRE